MRKMKIYAVALLTLVASASLKQNVSAQDKAFDDKIEKYLDSAKGREKIGKALESYMQDKQANARKAQEDQQAAQLEEQFKNPVKVDISKSPSKGPANAKVTIVEFSDFQCPYCKRGKDTMEAVLKAYPNDVKLVFKNLPLPFHNEAMPSAKAAMAANKQGKFFEMHDLLFDNQAKLGTAFYEESAKSIGLDVEKFKKDMNDPEIEKQIKEDMEIAKKNDIQGTPGFFVNGVAVKGAYPVEYFKNIIDRWLKK